MAASLISPGIAWIAATNRIVPKPTTFQTIETITAHMATLASAPNHSTGLPIDAEVDQRRG